MGRSVVRSTLHDQCVALLRRDLRAVRWQNLLPSEATMAKELSVSRMTLRRALSQLAEEGWLELGGKGGRHRITRPPTRPETPSGKVFRALTPYRFSELGSVNHQVLNEATERLGVDGFHLEVEYCPGLFSRFTPKDTKRLEALPDTAGWILLYGTKEIQHWLASLHQPFVTLGWTGEGLPITSVYPDTRAAARHATGLLFARGHRDLAYLIARSTSAGDRRAAEAFVDEAARLQTRARVTEHGETMDSIVEAISALMASRPRPTGFLVGSTQAAVTVQTCLQYAGLRIPEDAVVISMWHDVYLDFTYPPIARYRTNGRSMGKKVAHLLRHQLRHGNGKVHRVPFIPEFIDTRSVGRSPT